MCCRSEAQKDTVIKGVKNVGEDVESAREKRQNMQKVERRPKADNEDVGVRNGLAVKPPGESH